ncbi:hypothetical protein [Mycobacterium marinum]|uniref:hypothetical protein n=1 Tax=Mycobacterium marinum TaxID=1781 RepID=UPI002359FCF3|nr:hypothetical protein [Mycobacterium marinum]MDC9003761.1 hypothetical protein [Mycobacterium marinum]
MNDFFDNAEENVGDLLPCTDLERCGDSRGRRLRRLRAILEKATGFSAEVRDVLGHAGVMFPGNQVVAFDRVSLYIEGANLIVSVWPAELAPQYKRVYSNPKRAEAIIALTDDPAWQDKRQSVSRLLAGERTSTVVSSTAAVWRGVRTPMD